MTFPDDIYAVYKCKHAGHCPGGPPKTCAKNRDSTKVACGKCIDGTQESDSECVECGGSSAAGVFLLVIFALGAVAVLTLVVNMDVVMEPSATVECALLLGILFTQLQTVTTFNSLIIEWLNPLQGAFKGLGLVAFDLDVVGLGCVVGSDPVVSFGFRMLMVPLCFADMILVLRIKKMYRPAMSMLTEMNNTVGTILSIFFISMTISTFAPLICYSHPSEGRSSVAAAPSVLCFESDEHSSMVGIGLAAFFFIPVPFIALVVYGTRMYPQYVKADCVRSLDAFRFIFFRFKPERYYYGAILFLRNLGVCLVPVCIRSDAALQAIVLILVLVSSLVAQAFLQPWRSKVANYGDAIMTTALIILLLCGAMVTEYPDYESIKVVGITIFVGFIVAAFFLMTSALVKRAVPRPYFQTFICHDSSESAAQARVLKSIMQDNNAKGVFIDPHNEVAVSEHFDIARCKSDRFIIYLTRGALRNPRCAGEIVLAHKSGKEIQVVQMPDFIRPTEEQLNNMEQYLDLNKGSLATHGISLAQVKETYQELLHGESKWLKIEECPGGQQFRDMGQKLATQASFDSLQVKPLAAPKAIPGAVVVI